MDVCIFCLNHRTRDLACTYLMHHEYPEPLKKPEQKPKVSRSLCLNCGLHPKNPVSATNGCSHAYPPE